MGTPSSSVVARTLSGSSTLIIFSSAGTGGISELFVSFPYRQDSQLMLTLALVSSALNLILFLLFIALTIARYSMFPQSWHLMLRHPVSSLFTSCFPMGLNTLIAVAVDPVHVVYGFGGRPFLYFLWVLWWVEVAMSALCCWGLLHIM